MFPEKPARGGTAFMCITEGIAANYSKSYSKRTLSVCISVLFSILVVCNIPVFIDTNYFCVLDCEY